MRLCVCARRHDLLVPAERCPYPHRQERSGDGRNIETRASQYAEWCRTPAGSRLSQASYRETLLYEGADGPDAGAEALGHAYRLYTEQVVVLGVLAANSRRRKTSPRHGVSREGVRSMGRL